MDDELEENVNLFMLGKGLPVITTKLDAGLTASATGVRRNSAPLQCKVTGCTSDLTSAPKTHQRFRLCNTHIKAPTILVDGVASRFCQQCSRFHPLREFHGLNRTCRMMLIKNRARQRGVSSAACGVLPDAVKPLLPLLFTASVKPEAAVLPPAPMLVMPVAGCTTAAAAAGVSAATLAGSSDASWATGARTPPSGDPASPPSWQSEPRDVDDVAAEDPAGMRTRRPAAQGGCVPTAGSENAAAEPNLLLRLDLPSSTDAALAKPNSGIIGAANREMTASPAAPAVMPATTAAAAGAAGTHALTGAGLFGVEMGCSNPATCSPSQGRTYMPMLCHPQPCPSIRSGAAAVTAATAASMPSVPHSPVALAPVAMPRSASAVVLGHGCAAVMEAAAVKPNRVKGASVAGEHGALVADAATASGIAAAVQARPEFVRSSWGHLPEGNAIAAADQLPTTTSKCVATVVPLGAAAGLAMPQCVAAVGTADASGWPGGPAAGAGEVIGAAVPSVVNVSLDEALGRTHRLLSGSSNSEPTTGTSTPGGASAAATASDGPAGVDGSSRVATAVAAATAVRASAASPFSRCSAPADLCEHTPAGLGTLRSQLLEGSGPCPRMAFYSEEPSQLDRHRGDKIWLHHPQLQARQQQQSGQVARTRARQSLQQVLRFEARGSVPQLCDLGARASSRHGGGSGGSGANGGSDVDSGSHSSDHVVGCCGADGTLAVAATATAKHTVGSCVGADAVALDAVRCSASLVARAGMMFSRMSAPPERVAAPKLTCADLRPSSASNMFGRISAVATAAGTVSGVVGQGVVVGDSAGRGQLLLQRTGSSGSFKRRRSSGLEAGEGDGIASVRPCSNPGLADPVLDAGVAAAAAAAATEAKLDAGPENVQQLHLTQQGLPQQQLGHHQLRRGQQQLFPMDCDATTGLYNMGELRAAAAAAAAHMVSASMAESPDSVRQADGGLGGGAGIAAGGSGFGRVSAPCMSPLGRPSPYLPCRTSVSTVVTGGDGGGGALVVASAQVACGALDAEDKAEHSMDEAGAVTGPRLGGGMGVGLDAATSTSGVEATALCDNLLLASLAAEWQGEDGPDCIDQLLLEGLEEAAAWRRDSIDHLHCMPQQQKPLALAPALQAMQMQQAQAEMPRVPSVDLACAMVADPRVTCTSALSRAIASSWLATAAHPNGLEAAGAAQPQNWRTAALAGQAFSLPSRNCNGDGGEGGLSGSGSAWVPTEAVVRLRSAQSAPAWLARPGELQLPVLHQQQQQYPHPPSQPSQVRLQTSNRQQPEVHEPRVAVQLQTYSPVQLQAQPQQGHAAGLGSSAVALASTNSCSGAPTMANVSRHGINNETGSSPFARAPTFAARSRADAVEAATAAARVDSARGTTANVVVNRKAVGEETEEQLQLLLGDLLGEASPSPVSTAATLVPPPPALIPPPTTTTTHQPIAAGLRSGGPGVWQPQPGARQLSGSPSEGTPSVRCTIIGAGGRAPHTPGLESRVKGEANLSSSQLGPMLHDAALGQMSVPGRNVNGAEPTPWQRQKGEQHELQERQHQQSCIEQTLPVVNGYAAEQMSQPAPSAYASEATSCLHGGQPQQQQGQQQGRASAITPQADSGSSRRGARRWQRSMAGASREAPPAQALPDRDFLEQALRQQQQLWDELRAMQEQQHALLQQQMEQQRALARLLRVPPAAVDILTAKPSQMRDQSGEQRHHQQQELHQEESSTCGSSLSRPVPAFGRWSMPVIRDSSEHPLVPPPQHDRQVFDRRHEGPFARRSQQPDPWRLAKGQNGASLLCEGSPSAPQLGLEASGSGRGSGGAPDLSNHGHGLMLPASVAAAEGNGPSLAHPRLAWVQQQL